MIRQAYRRMAWFLRYYRKSYVLAVSFIMLNYILTIVPPWMVGYLSDRIMQQTITLPAFNRYLIILFAVVFVLYGVNYCWQYFAYKASDVISRATRGRLLRQYLAQGPIFFGKNSTGSLMGKTTNDVNSIADLASFGFMVLFDATLYPLAILIIMATTISWKLTLASILPLPFLIVAAKIIGQALYARFDEAQQAFDAVNDAVLENIAGVRVIRAYAREEGSEDVFAETADRLFEKDMRAVRLSALFTPMSRLIPSSTFIIALSYGSVLLANGELLIGQIVSFIFFLNLLTWPMFAIGEFINSVQQGTASMERIQELLDMPLDLVDEADAVV